MRDTNEKYYDIIKDENNYHVHIYKEEIVNKRNKGKIDSYRAFTLLDDIYPDDLEKCIKELKSLGYLNGSKVIPEDYEGILINNPIVKLKLMHLSHKIKILEKVYTDYIIDNINYILTYMVYIDLDTGLIKILYLGNLGIYNDNMINDLINRGYTYISDSSNQKLVLKKSR